MRAEGAGLFTPHLNEKISLSLAGEESFQQDNDPKHKCKKSHKKTVKAVTWPRLSLDFNPIENLQLRRIMCEEEQNISGIIHVQEDQKIKEHVQNISDWLHFSWTNEAVLNGKEFIIIKCFRDVDQLSAQFSFVLCLFHVEYHV